MTVVTHKATNDLMIYICRMVTLKGVHYDCVIGK